MPAESDEVPAHDGTIYNTNFTDDILSVEWRESELENDDLKNYKTKAEFYVRQHQDKSTIAKLRFNVPLTAGECRSWRTSSGARWAPDRTMRRRWGKSRWESLSRKSSA